MLLLIHIHAQSTDTQSHHHHRHNIGSVPDKPPLFNCHSDIKDALSQVASYCVDVIDHTIIIIYYDHLLLLQLVVTRRWSCTSLRPLCPRRPRVSIALPGGGGALLFESLLTRGFSSCCIASASPPHQRGGRKYR